MTNPTKTELIERLTISSAEKVQKIADLRSELATQGDEIIRLQRSCDHKDRQTANVSRVFVTLYEEKRTMDLRFGWLEEKATNVVSACEDHVHECIGELAEELGVDITGDLD